MRNQLILAAAAVPSLRVADVEYNTEQIIRLIAENSRCGLIVFPELSVTGYTCADLFGSELRKHRKPCLSSQRQRWNIGNLP